MKIKWYSTLPFYNDTEQPKAELVGDGGPWPGEIKKLYHFCKK